MSKTWRATLISGIAITALALAGCSSGAADPDDGPEPGGDTQTLQIGFITPLTGPSAATGIDARDGAEAAVEIWNESDRLPGYEIELVVEDDEGTPETGAIAYQKLRDQGIDIIAGTMNSSVAIAISNAVSADPETLYLISGAQSQIPLDEQAGNTIFGVNHNNSMFAEANLGWIKDVAQPQKVAVLAENSDFGVAEIEQLQAAWTDSDSPEIVLTETFDRTVTDFSAALAKVRESGADGLYVAAAGNALVAAIFTQADQQGLEVSKFTNAGLMSPVLIELGGASVEGLCSADIYHSSLENEANTAFVAKYEELFDKQPGALVSEGYDSINLILSAIEQVGSADDTQAIADALRDGQWDSSRGDMTFDDTGRALTDTYILCVEGGELVLNDTVTR